MAPGSDMSATHPLSVYRPRFLLVLALISLIISGLVSACAWTTQPQLVPGEGMTREQAAAREREIAKLRLAMLERETQITALEQKYSEAIQEVVRAKAKLRSLESKAEAASTMAEAEIALKVLTARTAGQPESPEIIQATHLLEMSGHEFTKENYGGALYLASQVKGLVQAGQGRLIGPEKMPVVSGEVLFATPIPLQAMARSNVRQGPGADYEVLFTLEKGIPLTGHSYKDDWVRIKDEDGRGGWIYQTLVGGR